jgi:hypothetical protein
MRDLFEQFVVSAKTGVTRVTGVTGAENGYEVTGLLNAAAVTQPFRREGNMGDTSPATCGSAADPAPDKTACHSADVTLSPAQGSKWVTARSVEPPKQDKVMSSPLPPLPLLPPDARSVDNAIRASALLSETFERIAVWWVEGAELPPDTLEVAIDDAVLAGDLGTLHAALSIYEQAARRCCSTRCESPTTRRCDSPTTSARRIDTRTG